MLTPELKTEKTFVSQKLPNFFFHWGFSLSQLSSKIALDPFHSHRFCVFLALQIPLSLWERGDG